MLEDHFTTTNTEGAAIDLHSQIVLELKTSRKFSLGEFISISALESFVSRADIGAVEEALDIKLLQAKFVELYPCKEPGVRIPSKYSSGEQKTKCDLGRASITTH